MATTAWVLGDQLSHDNPALEGAERVLIVESRAALTRAGVHRQKLHLLLSAMRHFAAELRARGVEVDLRAASSLRAGLEAHVAEHEPAEGPARALERRGTSPAGRPAGGTARARLPLHPAPRGVLGMGLGSAPDGHAALERLEPKGAIVGISAIVADYPTAGMAAYSATKAALSAYLSAVRRERRRQGLTVLDVRPQHMETGFSDRAVAGEPPPLPDPIDPDDLVSMVLEAVREGKREIAFDISAKELVVR